MDIKSIEKQILDELGHTLSQMNPNDSEKLYEKIQNADRIFLAAAGRSKFMLLGFGMRLMHLGYTVHIVGDATTPAICNSDLLIIASGSGETGSLVTIAAKAKSQSAGVVLVTTNAESTIGKMADECIVIPASTPKNAEESRAKSIQPGASLFEQSLLLYFDSFILACVKKSNLDIDHVMIRHANLE